ncbi:MAG: SAM-dependent chlorinase/fluorinase [Prevotellaceae bacterium]|jgi:S-adenosylmethionine hydrolase|nr:SAM-dependent chlorinase/fluorinase [Prevotellaceae bacterium]
MPIVTLTTDWGTSDFYVAALKGCILSMCPHVQVVDISHEVSHLDNAVQGAYKLRSAYPYFPEGSVHVVGVDSEAYPGEPFIATESGRQLFICKNNGFLSLMLDSLNSVTAIEQPAEKIAGFNMLRVVPPAIKKLLQGAPVGSLGEAVAPRTFTPPQPVVRFRSKEEAVGQGAKPCVSKIVGHVLYIDKYGNAITNITRELFYDSAQGRPYDIIISSERYKLSQVSSTYADAGSGMPVAFFNSQELLEIAVSYGNASHLYRLSNASSIIIIFQDK